MEQRQGVSNEAFLDLLGNLAANHGHMCEPGHEQPIPDFQAIHKFGILGP